MRIQIKPKAQIIVAIDRTKWRDNNLLMVSVIWEKRAWPIYWQFLPKKGSSNLAQQKAVLRPALRLLKHYQIVVVGDRELQARRVGAPGSTRRKHTLLFVKNKVHTSSKRVKITSG